ncbi:unnamed protein product [Closterium sp. NIES-65]|nr:unnamed protein product [Closterium sp. NIES-65]
MPHARHCLALTRFGPRPLPFSACLSFSPPCFPLHPSFPYFRPRPTLPFPFLTSPASSAFSVPSTSLRLRLFRLLPFRPPPPPPHLPPDPPPSPTTASSPVSRSARTPGSGVARRANRVAPRASADAEEPVTIDNSTVLVVGGGGVGMEVVRQLAKAGSWVTALQRGEKFRKEIEGLGAMLAIGDVMAPGTIEKALRGNTFDAVVSTVGGGLTDIKVDSDGNNNVIAAAEKAGVPRFVLVSSIGAGDSKAAVPGKEMDVLGPVLAEKEKSEERLKASDKLKWTIVRPGGLLSDAATGTGILTEDSSVVGVISRADVAQLILRILFEEKAEGKVFSAIDAQKKFPGAPEKEIVEFKV